MKMIKTKGIVVAQTRLGEYDKLLTLFTDNMGLISVSAKGATSNHNNLKAVARVFCYGDFVLYDKKNGYYTISEASPVTDFMGLARDLDRLDAANKIVAFTKYTAVENEESGDILRLILNSLHMLANTDKSINMIKCVYYLKSLTYMGIPPVTGECAICGSGGEIDFFSPEDGGIICGECAKVSRSFVEIEENTRKLMGWIIYLPLEKAFGIAAEEKLFEKVLEIIDLFVKVHLSYEL
ncbi:MAG: DNA repair protein RecO [Bacillota bacterium]|nr:DNA repair protein RecO [Bacillota bacterium]